MKTLYIVAALAAPMFVGACDMPRSTQTENSTAESVPTDTPAKPDLIALGQTGRANGVEFTLTDVSTPNSVGGGSAAHATEPGETYVVARYKLKNTGSKPLMSSDRPAISLIDGNGTDYASDMSGTLMASMGMDDSSGLSADLNPNVTAKSLRVWKVDKAAFNLGTWRLRVATDPKLTFSLK